MHLAKDRLDVALMTDRMEVVEHWRDVVGLRLEETLPIRRGQVQYRFDLCDSVLKVNVIDAGVDPARRSGIVEVAVADAARAGSTHTDPDGTSIRFVAPGEEGVEQIAVTLAVADAAAARRHYVDALGWTPLAGGVVVCGRTIVRWGERPGVGPVPSMPLRGWAYLTVQIHDCDAEHAGVVARGGVEGLAPVTLGTTARISMVRDPDTNWLELSQRASLTGPLPDR